MFLMGLFVSYTINLPFLGDIYLFLFPRFGRINSASPLYIAPWHWVRLCLSQLTATLLIWLLFFSTRLIIFELNVCELSDDRRLEFWFFIAISNLTFSLETYHLSIFGVFKSDNLSDAWTFGISCGGNFSKTSSSPYKWLYLPRSTGLSL